MENRLKYIFALLLSLSFFVATAQTNYQRVCDTIPYKMVNEKIIIPVKVQDTVVNFILDTGGQTGIIRSFGVRSKAIIKGNKSVGDFGGKGMSFIEAEITDVKYSNSFGAKRLKTLIFPPNGFFSHLGVVGILGSDAFAESVLTIDSKNQIIVINYPYRPHRLKIGDGFPIVPSPTHHPVLTTKFGDEVVEVLFDTGAQGFLSFTEADYLRIGERASVKVVDSFYGLNGIGIGGLGTPHEVKKVIVPNINFAGKIFRNTQTTLSQSSKTIIGLDLTKYGRVIIDYMRGVFYFMPYEDGEIEGIEVDRAWNAAVLPDSKGGFMISEVWSSMKGVVEYGEKVININGVDLKGIKQSQLEIDKIMDSIDGDTAYLIVVDKNGKQRKVIINKN